MEDATPASDKRSPPFGRYLIRERIAQGGMGEVFLAVAVGADGFEKPVVVKRLLPKFAGRTDVVNLLSAEAKLMTRLVHPNIVQVIDFGRGENSDYFLVMELVKGLDLGRFREARAAAGKDMPTPLVLFIATQVLRGLAHAHAAVSTDGQRLVHRDVSPGNILLSTFGEVKVADFGVALVASSAEPADQDNWFVGKPAYMAPEQLEQGAVDERADVYAVGVVLYQLLTGKFPRGAIEHGPGATERSALSVESHRMLEQAAPSGLAAIVLRALAPRREDRYPDAREMTRAIEHLAAEAQRIASADDLAEAVTEALRALPKRSRSVVVLTGGDGEGLAAGTELTHLTGGGSGGFTLKVALDAAMAERRSKGQNRRPWLLAALLISLAVVAIYGSMVRHGDLSRAAGVESPAAATDMAIGPSSIRAPIASANPALEPPSEVTTTPEPPVSARLAPRAHEAHELEPNLKSGLKEVPREPAASGCRGQVHIYATHGWIVSGGPGAVQAPGRYEWPCGTYGLRAISRVDAHDARNLSVTIREAAPGVVDLR